MFAHKPWRQALIASVSAGFWSCRGTVATEAAVRAASLIDSGQTGRCARVCIDSIDSPVATADAEPSTGFEQSNTQCSSKTAVNVGTSRMRSVQCSSCARPAPRIRLRVTSSSVTKRRVKRRSGTAASPSSVPWDWRFDLAASTNYRQISRRCPTSTTKISRRLSWIS